MSVTLVNSPSAVDWQYLAGLFVRAPLGSRDGAALEEAFRNSQVCCFAYSESKLIGAGRALTDKVHWTVIFDLVIEPKYQGQGHGKTILQDLTLRAGARNVMLQSVPGREAFYLGLGFKSMTTALANYANVEWAMQSGYVK